MSLKSIKLTDDNKKLRDLPDEVSGYIGAVDLHKFTHIFDPLNLTIRADIDMTARKTAWYFKINKYTAHKITLCGYISDQADSLINQNKGLLNTDIQVFPLPYREYRHEKEFNLYDKDLRIRARYISTTDIGQEQWLVDIHEEKAASDLSANHGKKEALKNNKIKEKSRRFSMDNPLVYIIVFVLITFIGFYLHKLGLNPESKI